MRSVAKVPATAAEIRRMVGDVDDTVVNSIERTEASPAEVLQAVQWFRGGGGLEDEAGHEPHGVVREIYEILQAVEAPEPER
jgi:hypothetical protein